MAVLDDQKRYLYVNPAAIGNPEVRRGIIGLTDEEYCLWRGHDPQIAVGRQQHFDEATHTRRPVDWEEVMRDANGHLKYHYRHYLPVFGTDGRLDRMVGYGRDDTGIQRRREMNSRQTEALRLCAQGAPLEAVLDQILSALESRFPQTQAALSLGEEALPGPAAPGITADILIGTARIGGLELNHSEAADFAEVQPVLDQLAGLAGMVIERDLHLKQLERLAYVDNLTSLMNRPAFVRALKQSLTGGQRPSVLVLDLKQLRNVNSRYGHTTGDALLIAVARRLTRDLPGCSVARIGGNGFAVLVSGGPEAPIVRALTEILSQPFAARDEMLYVNFSIGISPETQEGDDAETIVQQAEHALHRSKRLGHTISRYDAEEYATELTTMTLEAELRAGLHSSPAFPGVSTAGPGPFGRPARSGSASALDPPGTRSHLAAGLHRPGRTERADSGDRRLGDAGSLQGGGGLAGWAGESERQRLGAAIRFSALQRRRAEGAGRQRPAQPSAGTRTD